MWAWLAHFLGLDYSAPYGRIVPYNAWSGFLACAGGFAVVGGVATLVRKHKCHVHGCWRYARYPVEGTPYVVCSKHHPAIPNRVTAEHVALAYKKGKEGSTMTTQESPRSYYKDYVTPEAWLELRRWLVASTDKFIDDAKNQEAELFGDVLTKMDELVAPVPRVELAEEPRVELGVNLGGVFISETVLGELQDRENPALLERNVREALAKYGLAVRLGHGGWRGTELMRDFMDKYDEERGKSK